MNTKKKSTNFFSFGMAISDGHHHELVSSVITIISLGHRKFFSSRNSDENLLTKMEKLSFFFSFILSCRFNFLLTVPLTYAMDQRISSESKCIPKIRFFSLKTGEKKKVVRA